MTSAELRRVRRRLESFLEYCFTGMGRLERRRALGQYLSGLLLDGERKSIEPIAARLVDSPDETQAMRQRLQQAVVVARWDEGELYRRVANQFEKAVGGAEAFVIDDTGFPKKGTHSVGVQRQYSGTLGRIDNCQVATSVHLASKLGGVCIGMRLYMSETWMEDAARRASVGVPETQTFKTKHELALESLDLALSWGLDRRVVLADAGYGDSTQFREELSARELPYVVAINGSQRVWPEDATMHPPQTSVRGGRPRTRWTYPARPPSAKDLAASLDRCSWRKVTWTEGTTGAKSSRFAAIRVRTAHNYARGAAPGQEQWLLAEWRPGTGSPERYWLSTLPKSTSKRRLAYLAKLRWRIERDYQEMKGELGLDHFEGRTWNGFHHHCACVAAAHAFLTLERALFPPEQPGADTAGISSAAAAGTAPNHRYVPALSKTGPRGKPSPRPLGYVIE